MTQSISTITAHALPDLARVAAGRTAADAAVTSLAGAAASLEGTTVAFGATGDGASRLGEAFSALVRAEDAMREVSPRGTRIADQLREHALRSASIAGALDAASGARDLASLRQTPVAAPDTIQLARERIEHAVDLILPAARDGELSLESRTELASVVSRLDAATDGLETVGRGIAGETAFSSVLDAAAANMLDGRRALRLLSGDPAASASNDLLAAALDVRRTAGRYAAVERSTALPDGAPGIDSPATELEDIRAHAQGVADYFGIEHDAVTRIAAGAGKAATT